MTERYDNVRSISSRTGIPDGPVLPPILADRLINHKPEEAAARLLLTDVKDLLREDGVETTVNGDPAVATNVSYPEKVGEKKFFVRALYREDKFLGAPWHGLVFDNDPDVRVATNDPDMIQFEETPAGTVRLAVGPLVGEDLVAAGVLDYSRKVVDHLKEEVGKARERSAEMEQRQKNELELQRREKWEDRLDLIRKIGKGTGIFALTATAIGGAGYGIHELSTQPVFKTRYDANGYELDPAATGGLGATFSPAFSPELVADEDMADAPDINSVFPNDDVPYRDDNAFTLNDGIRRVTLTSSKDGMNCGVALIGESLPDDTQLAAWTNAIDANGNSRAHEFSVDLTTDRAQVCWEGDEFDDDDDPSVYLRLLNPGS